MKYLYFISYQFEGSDVIGRTYGGGNKTIVLDEKITKPEQLEKIQKEIKKEIIASSVVILFFTQLDCKIVEDAKLVY